MRLSVTDQYLVHRFNEEFHPPVDERPVFEVALKNADSDVWNPEDLALLARQPPDIYEQLFSTTKHPDLFRVARWLLVLGRDNGGSMDAVAISRSAREALRRISIRSRIDSVRVHNLTNDLDDLISENGEAET